MPKPVRAEARSTPTSGRTGRSVCKIFRPPERSANWVKNQIGFGEEFVVGHFGFLRPHKGVLELIEAFDVVGRSTPSAQLLLLCSEYPSADSHEYRRRCEARIAASPYPR